MRAPRDSGPREVKSDPAGFRLHGFSFLIAEDEKTWKDSFTEIINGINNSLVVKFAYVLKIRCT